MQNLEEPPGNYVVWKKSISKGHIIYDFINITFLECQIIGTENIFVIARD